MSTKPWGTQLFVAVVYHPHTQFADGVVSKRELGDWSCFLGLTEKEAVDKALAAATKWEAESGKDGHHFRPIGYYAVVSGELTTAVFRKIVTETETFANMLEDAGF